MIIRESRTQSSMATHGGRATTRSSAPDFDLDTAFPKMKMFLPATMLPTLASVVGMLRYPSLTLSDTHSFTHSLTCLLRYGSRKGISRSTAVTEVAKQIYAKWYHDSIPCVSPSPLRAKLEKLLVLVQEGQKRYLEQMKHRGERIVVTE